jgi:phage antirepressor YoqD-like protein
MGKITVDDAFIRLVGTYGIAEAAKKLGRRYATVREAAVKAGLLIKRGRPREKAILARNKAIRNHRKRKLLLREIAKKFGIGRERVRQILQETGGDPVASAWKKAALGK